MMLHLSGDTCGTVIVGQSTDEMARRLVNTTRQCLEKAIAVCAPGTP